MLLDAELAVVAAAEVGALLDAGCDVDCDVACGGGEGFMSEKLMLDIDILENDRLLVGSACLFCNMPP